MAPGRYERSSGIVSPQALQELAITLIGVGGIGSPTALLLAQMGCRSLVIVDPDVVAEENLAYQVFPVGSVGLPKVEAASQVLRELCGYAPITLQQEIKGDDCSRLQGVVISGVDSIEARRELWKGLKNNASVPTYIDARMAGEHARVLVVDPRHAGDIAFYEASLAGEPLPLSCTARGVTYSTFGTATLLAALVKRIAMAERLPREIRLNLATLDLFVWHRDEDLPEVMKEETPEKERVA